MKITENERSKYARIWEIDQYSQVSPGAIYANMFFDIAQPERGQSLLDVGAGSGAGSRVLKDRGLVVRGFDITDEGWKHSDIPLMTGCIWRDLPRNSVPPYDYGYCCDVMEHIPTEFTALAVSEIVRVCNNSFFSISFTNDHFGEFIGEPLHLTVKPFTWWRDMLREVGTVYEARDLLGDGVFYVGK